MFVRRKTLSGRTTFDRNFIIALKNSLLKAKLNNITVKLPHNYLQSGDENEIDIEEFLNLGRNFPSIIVRARNENQEEIKILFVNISSKAFFYDHAFPSGHSEPSEMYVSTSDPVRTWGLFEYFYNYLKTEKSSRFEILKLIGFFLSIVILVSEFTALIGSKNLFFNQTYNYSLAFDLGAILISTIIIYSYYNSTRGVYIKERKSSPSYFFLRILKGEFRDNPLFNMIISIIASIIASIIMSYVQN